MDQAGKGWLLNLITSNRIVSKTEEALGQAVHCKEWLETWTSKNGTVASKKIMKSRGLSSLWFAYCRKKPRVWFCRASMPCKRRASAEHGSESGYPEKNWTFTGNMMINIKFLGLPSFSGKPAAGSSLQFFKLWRSCVMMCHATNTVTTGYMLLGCFPW